MYSVFAPTFPSHSRTVLAVNSGPLSERMCSGTPLAVISSARVSITSGDRMLRPARMARQLPGVLFDDGQQPHWPAVPGPQLHEVISPNMVFPLGPQPDAGPVVQPQSASPGLSGRYFEPLPPPDPLHPFVVHYPAAASEHRGDPPVPVTAEPGGQPHYVVG